MGINVRPSLINVVCEILVERGLPGADAKAVNEIAHERGFSFSDKAVVNVLGQLKKDGVLRSSYDGRYFVPPRVKHVYQG